MLTPSSLLFLTYFFGLIGPLAGVYPTAGLNTTWIATISDVNNIMFDLAGASAIPVLLRGHNGWSFVCGFYSRAFAESYFFAVSIVQPYSNINVDVAPAVVWSANWNRPVGSQATLEFTEGGDLVSKDADGFVAWSTQTYGKSVAGINLIDTGNLVLFNENNAAVWESFNDPKDTLLPGQKLRVGQKLTPSDSTTNMTEPGFYSLSLTTKGLFAQIETDPPQVYHLWRIHFMNTSNDSNYVEFTQGQIGLFVNFARNGSLPSGINSSSAVQYLKFESEGHLRVYQLHQNGWSITHDTLKDFLGRCGCPMVL